MRRCQSSDARGTVTVPDALELTGDEVERDLPLHLFPGTAPLQHGPGETLLGIETNAANWQRKQNQNNNFSAVLPYDIEQQRKETKEYIDDLTSRDDLFKLLTPNQRDSPRPPLPRPRSP